MAFENMQDDRTKKQVSRLAELLRQETLERTRAEDGLEKASYEAAPVDNVNHPPHYASGGIECIEAIKAQLTREGYLGALHFNVAKYVWRWRDKGGVESLEKAQWYLTRLINELKQENNND